MACIDLTGSRYNALLEALVASFPMPGTMDVFLQTRLGKILYTYVGGGGIRLMYFELVKHALAECWADELILEALNERPDRGAFHALAQSLGLTALPTPAATETPGTALQRIVDTTNSLIDVTLWRQRLSAIEGRVCRVEVPLADGRRVHGTAFLVGPDLALTNYHVMKPVLDGEAQAADVTLRFDYRVVEDGASETVVSKGTVVCLTDDWNVDASPYSAADEVADPPAPPPADELDYALLRLAGAPGDAPIGEASMGAVPRGWIAMSDPPSDLSDGQPVLILQHPEGAPLKLAIDTDGVLGVNVNRTRVRYATNTMKGSSGAPVFDADWNLVALHHAGDPNFDVLHQPTYNQGIPIPAIRALLAARGLADVLPEAT